MTTYFTQLCSRCGHQRQLHKFPSHSYSVKKDGTFPTPWKRKSNDPGCRVGHERYIAPIADGVFTVPHQGDKCPCKEFESDV